MHGKKHGRWVETWPDGTIYEGEYVDGKRDGRWVATHPDGAVWERRWHNGTAVGDEMVSFRILHRYISSDLVRNQTELIALEYCWAGIHSGNVWFKNQEGYVDPSVQKALVFSREI